MKPKRLKDKLVLNKKTIINLTLENMKKVNGGGSQRGPAGASCRPTCR